MLCAKAYQILEQYGDRDANGTLLDLILEPEAILMGSEEYKVNTFVYPDRNNNVNRLFHLANVDV